VGQLLEEGKMASKFSREQIISIVTTLEEARNAQVDAFVKKKMHELEMTKKILEAYDHAHRDPDEPTHIDVEALYKEMVLQSQREVDEFRTHSNSCFRIVYKLLREVGGLEQMDSAIPVTFSELEELVADKRTSTKTREKPPEELEADEDEVEAALPKKSNGKGNGNGGTRAPHKTKKQEIESLESRIKRHLVEQSATSGIQLDVLLSVLKAKDQDADLVRNILSRYRRDGLVGTSGSGVCERFIATPSGKKVWSEMVS
jgi:hypothetical protein